MTLFLGVLLIVGVLFVLICIEEQYDKRQARKQWEIEAREKGWLSVPIQEPRSEDWHRPDEIDFDAARAAYWAEHSSASDPPSASSVDLAVVERQRRLLFAEDDRAVAEGLKRLNERIARGELPETP